MFKSKSIQGIPHSCQFTYDVNQLIDIVYRKLGNIICTKACYIIKLEVYNMDCHNPTFN